jgi:hypothetical protein
LLHDGNDFALLLPNFLRGLFYGLLEARNNQQHKWSDRHRDEREIPIQPKHNGQHADNGKQVHYDSERRRRRESLDRLHVRRDRA